LNNAWEGLPFERGYELPSELENLEAALKRLRHLMPEEKPALLNALVRCVEHDGKVNRGGSAIDAGDRRPAGLPHAACAVCATRNRANDYGLSLTPARSH